MTTDLKESSGARRPDEPPHLSFAGVQLETTAEHQITDGVHTVRNPDRKAFTLDCLAVTVDLIISIRTTDNKAGFGICMPKKNVNISLRTSSHSYISSIELAAIEDCLVHVKDSYQGETFDTVILSDSLSASRAISITLTEISMKLLT